MRKGACSFKAGLGVIILLALMVVLTSLVSERSLLPTISLCSTSNAAQALAAPINTVISQNLSQTIFFSNERSDVYESFCPNDADCFDKLWPHIKDSLCPAMVPNTDLTDAIFAIARDEVGLRQWNGTDQSLSYFYKGSPDPTGFVYTSPENKTMVYMSIWKVAHETVEVWARRNVEPLEGDFRVTSKPVLRKLLQEAPDACILATIRDPISHFLSGYNEVDTRVLEREHDPIHARMRDAPKGLYHRYHYGTKQRFEQFVADILSQPYTLGWSDFPLVQPLHFYSMSGALYLLGQYGVNLTSFLPSIENLGNAFPKFALQACPGVLPENITHDVTVAESGHESSKDKFGIYKAAKDVWTEGGSTARALCVLHAIDYACWENMEIPALCKEVYTSSSFIERIL